MRSDEPTLNDRRSIGHSVSHARSHGVTYRVSHSVSHTALIRIRIRFRILTDPDREIFPASLALRPAAMGR